MKESTNEVVIIDGNAMNTSTTTSSNSICTIFPRRNTLFFQIDNLKLLQVNLNFDNQMFPNVDSASCINVSPEVDILDALKVCIEENFKLIAINVSKERLEPIIVYNEEGIHGFEIYPISSSASTSQPKTVYPILIDGTQIERISEFYLEVYCLIKN